MEEKIKLYGFNNLTKALSFNIYDVCYAKTARELRDYIGYIDGQYNSERLTNILTTRAQRVKAMRTAGSTAERRVRPAIID